MGTGNKNQEMDSLIKRYKEICADLNMNKSAADEALSSFHRIGNNYSLEGEKLHWLACALYVACRKGLTPTVGRSSYVEGNCVSLTRLLKLCNLSLTQFFIMMKKWADMANLAQDMRNRIDVFERNFNVTTIIFKKYRPIFSYVFKDPTSNQNKQSKSRKQKARSSFLTSNDLFQFCWTLFVQVKSDFPDISLDLVNSYHLLIACVDFCYNNLLFTENAKEILNPNFPELPDNFSQDDYIMPENCKCIIGALCDKFQGIQIDAKGIKEHWWKPHIKRMVERKVLKCRNLDQLIGFLDSNNFESNQKTIAKEYEVTVLSTGDFDETIFIHDSSLLEGNSSSNDSNLDLSAQLNQAKSIEEKRNNTLAPCTPLSNRHYLNNRDLGAMTPVSNATQTISRLQSLLIGFKDQPSSDLLNLFEKCTENPTNAIKKRVSKMGDCFVKAYTLETNNENSDNSTVNGVLSSMQQSQDFAKRRLQFAVTFYYKMLENIAKRESKMITNSSNLDALSSVLSNEMFHVSLFACSIEIVLFAYKSQKVFPWIIEIMKDFNNLQFQACDFYKVIELIIRDENGLSRDIVKHLTSLEEKILESMAWKSDSNLWDKIKAQGQIPAFQDIALHSSSTTDLPSTPVSAIKRSTTSAQERFNSPVNSSIRRRLFDSNGDSQTSNTSQSNSTPQAPAAQQSIVQLALGPATGQDQSQTPVYYIINKQQLQQINNSNQQQQESNNQDQSTSVDNASVPAQQQNKPKVGALGLFFRKFYYLAWVRLKDLCERLRIGDEDILRKIWTCFEYALRNHFYLMKDRHLDQIIMCTIYSMCKITKRQVTFHEIMQEYRFQPHCQSHVYRSILLNNKKSIDTELSQQQQKQTPNKNGNVEYNEDRGDIIMFYNQIYVTELKKYILKFQTDDNSPPLSPLPRKTSNPISPFRKVSLKHPVFVSPLKSTNLSISPAKKHSTYCFSISPANDLKAINQMVKTSNPPTYSNTNSSANSFQGIMNATANNGKKISKRIFQDDSGDYSPTKRICPQSVNLLTYKLENVFSDRELNESENGDSNID